MKEKIISACILAVGIIVLGLCLKGGIDNYVNKDRVVSVKGLAEKEVMANKATWNLKLQDSGSNLKDLYSSIANQEKTVKAFLKKNGIKDEDIHINAPLVTDRSTNYYQRNEKGNRYFIRLTLSVSSNDVKAVQNVFAKQGELINEGIALASDEYSDGCPVSYDYEGFSEVKPEMMKEAIANAQKTAEQFAENSKSKLNKIITADQGQFSIDAVDENIPYKMKIRVVTTITYSLKD